MERPLHALLDFDDLLEAGCERAELPCDGPTAGSCLGTLSSGGGAQTHETPSASLGHVALTWVHRDSAEWRS